jgi:metal-responsive CopG/Arc/MetJ family transcriptional regulator
MARVTFSLSDETIAELRRTAARLRKPQSHVVRDAIAEYAARSDRLSDDERRQALAVLQQLRTSKSSGTAADVDAELQAVRAARRRGGRRHRAA